jgi:carbonic anhydrase
VPVIDELLANNAAYARYFTSGELPMWPGKKVAVLACMDARLNIYGALGLRESDAHVIRNAGGVASDDAIRSLVISQRLLGTREIMLIHHTDCGMLTFRDDEVKVAIEADTGLRPPFALEAFPDPRAGYAPVDPPHHGKPVCAPQGQRAWLRLRRGHRQAPRGDLI